MALNTPSATDIRIALASMANSTMAQARARVRARLRAAERIHFTAADKMRMARAALLAFEHKFPGERVD